MVGYGVVESRGGGVWEWGLGGGWVWGGWQVKGVGSRGSWGGGPGVVGLRGRGGRIKG